MTDQQLPSALRGLRSSCCAQGADQRAPSGLAPPLIRCDIPTCCRFGHDTMPIKNLFKNCSYYYGFAAYVAYFVNHPKYTAPPEWQSLICFALAVVAQLSNLRSVPTPSKHRVSLSRKSFIASSR